MHRAVDWKLKYTPEDGDLVKLFYVPALEDAKRYDRLTGYFRASALTLAARGIEGLVRNQGHMRLIVGCTLEPNEIAAIHEGSELRGKVAQHLRRWPLRPEDGEEADALELLAWMVANDHLNVKVAVPTDEYGRPVTESALFHEKTGIIEDTNGDRIAWTGSLNETASGWQHNWETINVYTSWGTDPARVDVEEQNFEYLWADRRKRARVIEVPEAVRENLLKFAPRAGLPKRLKPDRDPLAPKVKEPDENVKWLRERVWSFIRKAPSLTPNGETVGEATAPITPWPHQIRAFERMYHDWPPKLLIADEVGLGKTIQAGMVLRQAWLSGRARRILIVVPAAVMRQWQIELYEKFNLNWPIYEGGKLRWYSPNPERPPRTRTVKAGRWHLEDVVIASSHLMRRRERQEIVFEEARKWDLVVLDEAHHARRRGAGGPGDRGPNELLRLMRGMRERGLADGLVLLTATPMQVHPVEFWDLLDLLGLPAEWSADAFVEFFKLSEDPDITSEAFEMMARLFRAEERVGQTTADPGDRLLSSLSRLKAKRVLSALRDPSTIPRRRLGSTERSAALRLMRARTPVRRLLSRHTRALLRRYHRQGLLKAPIAERRVKDCFVEMTEGERELYEAVESYISHTYGQATGTERSAVGFIMTVYRRRLASSCQALASTLRRRLETAEATLSAVAGQLTEDLPDDELADDVMGAPEDVTAAADEALQLEELGDIHRLLQMTERLPTDSKLGELQRILRELRAKGGKPSQVMVFTQYTDTIDFLREQLCKDSSLRLMCFTGRGGEVPEAAGRWRAISRDEAKRRFREGEADVLLCTEAAGEGLNFQFCGALVNYDMPWNPMRVEQRIGRIDRLGQENSIIRIFNLHYRDTVEADIYQALAKRIELFQGVVGQLQPILARVSGTITQAVLEGRASSDEGRAALAQKVDREAAESVPRIDIDEAADTSFALPGRLASSVTMDDLDRIIQQPELLPDGFAVQALRSREYSLTVPGRRSAIRVTTDADYFERHADSVELWSPGGEAFPTEWSPVSEHQEWRRDTTLRGILDLVLSLCRPDVTRTGESLHDVMAEITQNAKARGLTPEILEELLRD